jgi:hypothetical protein
MHDRWSVMVDSDDLRLSSHSINLRPDRSWWELANSIPLQLKLPGTNTRCWRLQCETFESTSALMLSGRLRKAWSTLKYSFSSAHSWCRLHPVASTLGACIVFVLGLLVGLLFAVFRSEIVRITENIQRAAANQTGVRYSFLIRAVIQRPVVLAVSDSVLHGLLYRWCFLTTFTR